MKGRRVAIIGAGLGGLSAGIALHQAGFDVKIFEKHEALKPLGGAILFNAIGLTILRSYGIDTEDFEMTKKQLFRRYDGHQRVLWEVDADLIKKADVGGWITGFMRSDLYKRMLAKLPDDLIKSGHELLGYEETPSDVTLHFGEGKSYSADLVIGADGINSRVREQLWGKSELKHLGIAVWLGWANLEGSRRDELVCMHNDKYQLGYSPLIYKGKKSFEFWFVEPCTENQQEPKETMGYIKERTKEFVSPVPEILNATSPENVFRWVIKYRDLLSQWSKGRVTLLGDACHATSPYAGYGAGMAVEDGFFLGKLLRGYDLSSLAQLNEALKNYDEERVEYCNDVVKFAKNLGDVFHNYPKPIRKIRDLLLDHTKIPQRQISKGFTGDAQKLLSAVLE